MYGVVPKAGGVRRIGESDDGTAATQMGRVKVMSSRDVAVQMDSCDSTNIHLPASLHNVLSCLGSLPRASVKWTQCLLDSDL